MSTLTLHDASRAGDTERVKQLLAGGTSVDEKDEDGMTALKRSNGHTEVVKLLLNNGASVLEMAGRHGVSETITSRLGHRFDQESVVLQMVLSELSNFDEDQLGCMAAALVSRHLMKGGQGSGAPALKALATTEAEAEAKAEQALQEGRKLVAKAVLELVRLAGFARDRARMLRTSDPRSADDHQVLFARLQLAAAACAQSNEFGKARANKDVQKLFRSGDGRKALDHAVQIEAKELLAQPVVQTYMKVAWRGEMSGAGNWFWSIYRRKSHHKLIVLKGVALLTVMFLLQLLFVLPLVALLPFLDRQWSSQWEKWSSQWEGAQPWESAASRHARPGSPGSPAPPEMMYFLRLPYVKFGLECAADLALALALTLIPAADLATAPAAPLLLIWVGSGLLWEARQLMAPSSSDASWRLIRVYDRLMAYWADSINRVDATALIFSFAALVAFISANDSEDATATSLRAVAVFLLWLRVIRALLVSPQFGPFVLMFFRMLFGDVLYFLVLLFFLLVAFAASWTVLLPVPPSLPPSSPPSSSLLPDPLSSDLADHLDDELSGCADEFVLKNGGAGGFFSTLVRLLEGALTGNDHFECARNSTNSPVTAWVISFAYVTLTAVLLLNMLIAMCAAAHETRH